MQLLYFHDKFQILYLHIHTHIDIQKKKKEGAKAKSIRTMLKRVNRAKQI